ncbi:MAG: type II secretion system F family protein, partial [Pseudomonadota bacterium]
MLYKIRALTSEQLLVTLTMNALNEEDARQLATAQRMVVVKVTPTHNIGTFKWTKRATQQSAPNLIFFSQELLALLKAGLSIVEAMEALLEKESNFATRSMLNRLLIGLREGKRLSSVLIESPQHFSVLYVGIIKSAEGTSDLPKSLARYIDYQQRVDIVRGKLISAAIYPSILLVVGIGVSLFLICYVVPKFADVFHDSGRDMPWLSQVLLNWG